jgi:hypothetical protein
VRIQGHFYLHTRYPCFCLDWRAGSKASKFPPGTPWVLSSLFWLPVEGHVLSITVDPSTRPVPTYKRPCTCQCTCQYTYSTCRRPDRRCRAPRNKVGAADMTHLTLCEKVEVAHVQSAMSRRMRSVFSYVPFELRPHMHRRRNGGRCGEGVETAAGLVLGASPGPTLEPEGSGRSRKRGWIYGGRENLALTLWIFRRPCRVQCARR